MGAGSGGRESEPKNKQKEEKVNFGDGRRFDETEFAIPFGHYIDPEEQADAHSGMYVGRESQRSFIINLLVDVGRRTAILVTGRRGSGKTAFVEHCISEYEASNFRRFLRSKHGRSISDILIVCIFGFAILYAALVISTILEIHTVNSADYSLSHVVVVLLSVICILPIAYAWNILMTALKYASALWLAKRLFFLAVLAILALMILLGPSGSPALSMSRLLLALAIVAVLGDLTWPRWVARRPLFSESVFVFLLVVTWIIYQFGPVHITDILPIVQVECPANLNSGLCHDARETPFVQASLHQFDRTLEEFLGNIVLALLLASVFATRRAWLSRKPAKRKRGAFTRGTRHWWKALRKRKRPVRFLIVLIRNWGSGENAVSNEQSALRWAAFVLLPMLVVFITAFVKFILVEVGVLSAPIAGHNYVDFKPANALIFFFVVLFFTLVWRHILLVMGKALRVPLRIVLSYLNPLLLFFEMKLRLLTRLLFMRTGKNPARHRNLEQGQSSYRLNVAEQKNVPRDFAIFPTTSYLLVLKSIVIVIVVLQILYPVLIFASIHVFKNDTRSVLNKVSESLYKENILDPVFFPKDGSVNPSLPDTGSLDRYLKGSSYKIIESVVAFEQKIWEKSKEHTTLTPTTVYANRIFYPRPIISPAIEPPKELISFFGRTSDASEAGSDNAAESQRIHYHFSLFQMAGEEVLWMAAGFLLFGGILLLEYVWIYRGQEYQRVSRAIDPGPRPPWQENHFFDEDAGVAGPAPLYGRSRFRAGQLGHAIESKRRRMFRSLEHATFLWYLFRVWMPTIVVRINLGFDTLDHRGVTHTMVTGLMQEYRNTFIRWTSAYVVLSHSIGALAAALLVNSVAQVTMDFPLIVERSGKLINVSSEREKDHIDVNLPARQASPNSVFDIAGEPIDYCLLLSAEHLLRSGRIENRLTEQFDELQDLRPSNKASNGQLPRSRAEDRLPLEQPKRTIIANVLCQTFPSWANGILSLLYLEILSADFDNKTMASHFAFAMLHRNRGLPELHLAESSKNREMFLYNPEGITFRVYHLTTFLLIWAAAGFLINRLGLLPYRRTYTQLKDLSISLTSTERIRRRHVLGTGIDALRNLYSGETTREIERQEMDPRNVELNFLNLLRSMRAEYVDFPVTRMLRMSVPSPEITFIFDELDKVSGIVAEEGTKANSTAELELIDAERRRAYALHGLLSDMKRVISSAPARFIFVGSRLLHDEWMADKARRQPLLSSIFTAEIYLPSLLVDKMPALMAPNMDYERRQGIAPYPLVRQRRHMTDRIWEFLYRQYIVARQEMAQMRQKRMVPIFTLPTGSLEKQDFPDDPVNPDYISTLPITLQLQVRDTTHGNQLRELAGVGWERAVVERFVQFLTMRSAGNPKKLRELLSNYVHPTARVVPNTAWRNILPGRRYFDTQKKTYIRWKAFSSDSVIYLPDRELYRTQVISSIYRHIAVNFENDLLARDDKTGVATFYLFDFILKFHGRAFNWGNLERIDELAHVHRTPDIRQLVEQLVDTSSEKLLHPVLNGMYHFRFRSDFGMEIRYLSRLSETEQAALNFTLDESQGLKATYKAMLRQSHATNVDLIAGLGELYEYDQEYELARHNYRHAIRIMDETLFFHIGRQTEVPTTIEWDAEGDQSDAGMILQRSQKDHSSGIVKEVEFSAVSTLKAALSPNRFASDIPHYFPPWGGRRLRLMLQIAMTFELARDFESAIAHYRNATQFSQMLIAAFAKGFQSGTGATQKAADEKEFPTGRHAYVLNHVNILFEPFFAEAWMIEKQVMSVDLSVDLLEARLQELREGVDFLKHKFASYDQLTVGRLAAKPADDARAQAVVPTMIGAALHNKAGDLYMMKGRPLVERTQLPPWATPDDPNTSYDIGTAGFVLKAHYHYAVSLHELRRFIVFRRIASSLLNIGGNDTPQTTIPKFRWPKHVAESLYNNCSDIGDCTIARVSLLQVIKGLPDDPRPTAAKMSCEKTCPDGSKCGEECEISLLDLFQERAFAKLPPVPKLVESFYEAVRDWLESPDRDVGAEASRKAPCLKKKLTRFLGAWNSGQDSQETLEKWRDGKIADDHGRLLFGPSTSAAVVVFSKPTSAPDRLLMGILFLLVGAEFAQEAGFEHSAAKEYLLTAETIGSFLSRLRSLRSFQGAKRQDAPKEEEVYLTELEQFRTEKPRASALYDLLLALADYALEKYDHIVGEKNGNKSGTEKPRDYVIGSIVEPAAVTISANLFFTTVDLQANQTCRIGISDTRLNIFKRVRKWLGDDSLDAFLYGCRRDWAHAVGNPDMKALRTDFSLLDEYCTSEQRSLLRVRLNRIEVLAKAIALSRNSAQEDEFDRLIKFVVWGMHKFGEDYTSDILNEAFEFSDTFKKMDVNTKFKLLNGRYCDLKIDFQHMEIQHRFEKSMRSALRAWLYYVAQRHRFPALNQMGALKTLIDDAVMNDPSAAEREQNDEAQSDRVPTHRRARVFDKDRVLQVLAQLEELEDLSESFDAPMHFPPSRLGGSAAIFAMRVLLFENPGLGADAWQIQGMERILETAATNLRKGREMFTMGRQYYETISRLHYLYDDFNDRRLHSNHASQMAGMETIVILEEIIETLCKRKRERTS